MGKPSIFSNDYRKKLRRRRILIGLTVVCAVIVVIAICLLTRNNFKKKITDIKTEFLAQENNENIQVDKENANKKDLNKQENQIEPPEKPIEEKKEEGYTIDLSNGLKVKVVFEGQGREKEFKYISPLESKIQYDISPNGKLAVIFDDKVQRIKCIDIDGKVTDITRNQYISTSGTVVVNHDEWLQSIPDYIWCAAPKFIDDNNIAYISQLPWLNKSTKYIWITNNQGNNHIYVSSISGEDIRFNGINPKGLEVTIDGNIFYLKSTGEVVK